MEKNVRLKIILPDRVYKEQDARRVIIPGLEGDMTILPERAPAVVTLANGYVRVLDGQDNATDKYFIIGGLANIADDVCTVSSGAVIPEEHIGQYGVFNYVNWRSQYKRKNEVIKRYHRRMRRVDEKIKHPQ